MNSGLFSAIDFFHHLLKKGAKQTEYCKSLGGSIEIFSSGTSNEMNRLNSVKTSDISESGNMVKKDQRVRLKVGFYGTTVSLKKLLDIS